MCICTHYCSEHLPGNRRSGGRCRRREASAGHLAAASLRVVELERELAAERALCGDESELGQRLRVIKELAARLNEEVVPWTEQVLRNLAAHIMEWSIEDLARMSPTETNRVQRMHGRRGRAGLRTPAAASVLSKQALRAQAPEFVPGARGHAEVSASPQ